MSSNELPITPDETVARPNLPCPDIVLTADNGEETPAQATCMIDPFVPGTELWDQAMNIMTSSMDTLGPIEMNSTLPNDSMQCQMQVLPSSFAPAPTPSPIGPSRVVSPGHESPHSAPLSYSEFDQRYWQGFFDGNQAACLEPALSAENLPPSLRGRRLSFGANLGVENFQQPAVFGPGTTGMFTAPTTPLNLELNQEASSDINTEASLHRKVGDLFF